MTYFPASGPIEAPSGHDAILCPLLNPFHLPVDSGNFCYWTVSVDSGNFVIALFPYMYLCKAVKINLTKQSHHEQLVTHSRRGFNRMNILKHEHFSRGYLQHEKFPNLWYEVLIGPCIIPPTPTPTLNQASPAWKPLVLILAGSQQIL